MFHHLQRSISSRQAEGLHRRALEGSESQLGPQHPDTLNSVNNLANLLEQAGQVGGGRDEVLGVHRSCGKTGTGEFSCFPLSPRTDFMMFCE